MRRYLGLLLKVAVSLVLLVYLFAVLDTEKLLAAIRSLHVATFAAAIAFSLVAYVGRAARWRSFLRHAGARVNGRVAYQLTLLGLLYGLVTPGRVGEFGKVAHLGLRSALTIPSVVWERLLDVLLLEILCLPAFITLGLWKGPVPVVYAAALAATLGAAFVLNGRSGAKELAKRFPPLRGHLESWIRGATGIMGTGIFRAAAGWTLVYYAFNFAAGAFIAMDLQPEAGLTLVSIFPVIILFGNIPVTLAGLGLREYVAARAFARVGVSPEFGPALSLAWFTATTLVPGVIGMLMWQLDTVSRKKHRA